MLLRLCDNCLATEAATLPVGGGEVRATVDLCPTCQRALLRADFDALCNEEADERLLRRRDL